MTTRKLGPKNGIHLGDGLYLHPDTYSDKLVLITEFYDGDDPDEAENSLRLSLEGIERLHKASVKLLGEAELAQTQSEEASTQTQSEEAPTQQPSLGRIVHYVLSEEESTPDQTILPAIITRVWSNTCVNLHVLDDGSFPLAGTRHRLSVELNKASPATTPNTWYWPQREESQL